MRLPWPDGPFVVPEGTPGAITIVGRMYDGAGNVIPDGLVETWQADPAGRFAHPDDPRGPSASGYQAFRGFGRCPTAPPRSPRLLTLPPRPPSPPRPRRAPGFYLPAKPGPNAPARALQTFENPGGGSPLPPQPNPADPADPGD